MKKKICSKLLKLKEISQIFCFFFFSFSFSFVLSLTLKFIYWIRFTGIKVSSFFVRRVRVGMSVCVRVWRVIDLSGSLKAKRYKWNPGDVINYSRFFWYMEVVPVCVCRVFVCSVYSVSTIFLYLAETKLVLLNTVKWVDKLNFSWYRA